MAKKKTLTISAPIGLVEDAVLVCNYKMRPPLWEPGRIVSVAYYPEQEATRYDGSPYTIEPRWRYEVWVDRERTEDKYGRQRGGGYRLTVSDDGVRPLGREG